MSKLIGKSHRFTIEIRKDMHIGEMWSVTPLFTCDACSRTELNPGSNWFTVREKINPTNKPMFCIEPFANQPKHRNWKRVHSA